MDKFFFIITDYVNGKVIYPPIRRILNFLFSISIASFIFEKFYFKYEWLDPSYKSILDFFVKGSFFIPFSLFVVVHFLLYFFSSALFSFTTTRKSSKALTQILKFQLKKSHVKSFKRKLKNNPITPIAVDAETWINIYEHIRSSVTADQIAEFQKALDAQKQIIEHNFNLIVKLIVVVTIYFVSINHFGWILYALVLLLSIGGLIVLWWLHLALEIIPAAVRKFDHEVQKYLQSNQLIPTENV